jgi:hypothetical protein
MDNNIVLNYVNYFADITYGYASYAKDYANYGTFAAGIHYINYGKFIEADNTGLILGQFKAAEYAINLFWSKQIDSLFSVGINLKTVISNLYTYNSYGILGDIGVTYHNKKHLFSSALVVRNAGMQIKSYYTGNSEPMPFEIQLGATQRLRYAPLRISITAQHLETYTMTYNDTTKIQIDPFTNKPIPEKKFDKFADNLARHFILGIEFIPIENFYFSLGYNYQRRKELELDDKSGWVGFSWGFGIKVSKFRFSFGRATYQLSGASNHFSISMNLSDFYKRKEML